MDAKSNLNNWEDPNYVHPWHDFKLEANHFAMASRGEGIYLYDNNGKRHIDGPGGMWCVNLGYGRTEIADAIANQAKRLPYCSPWYYTNEPAADLAKQIAQRTPGDLNNVFFTTCGSTAIDSALRFVQFYFNFLDKPQKKTIIARDKGYHGSTYLAASVSGKERDKRKLDTISNNISFLSDVNPNLRDKDETVEEWCDNKVNELENRILELGAETIAAFVAEPILASGGVIIPPNGYHKKTKQICEKYDILYISDEVVTGFGRLGHWFASEAVFDIIPDIITCAKGLTSGYIPMGATIISNKLMKNLQSTKYEEIIFSNGFTYSGHPVSAAAGLKVIEIMEAENILEHVKKVTPYFQERLKRIEADFEIVKEARGIGLLGCLEGNIGNAKTEEAKLKKDYDFGYLIDKEAEKRGLVIRPIINMCVFSPALTITTEEISTLFDILESSLKAIEKSL